MSATTPPGDDPTSSINGAEVPVCVKVTPLFNRKNAPLFRVVKVVSLPRISVPEIETFGGSPLPTVTGGPVMVVLLSRLKKLDWVVREPPVNDAKGAVPVLVIEAPSAMLNGGASGLIKVAPDATMYGPATDKELPG